MLESVGFILQGKKKLLKDFKICILEWGFSHHYGGLT